MSSRPHDDIQKFMRDHPSPDVLEVHPLAWARKVEKTLKCKNSKDSPECRTCKDYDKQYMKCFEEES